MTRVRPKDPEATEPTEDSSGVDPQMVARFFRALAISDAFASHAKEAPLTLEDFPTENWIEWKALRTAAPVDRTTIDRAQRGYYAPEPLVPGQVFSAPDNPFWRSLAEQGVIERAKK